MPNNIYDSIIIGAGAAGLMCACQAGQRGKKILLLDHAETIGKKIRISGGGRCNFTNINSSQKNFLSQNPKFSISALNKYLPQDFVNLVEKYQIKYHEKTLGQLFCDNSSKEIIAMLLDECEKGKVEILLKHKISKVEKDQNENFKITANSQEFLSKKLVIATGGISIPKMGATDFGYKIAQQFGLKIINPQPALVPFIFEENLLFKTKNLAGISIFSEVTINKIKFLEAILFTHKGISGPAILQISSYWQKGKKVTINFLPKIDLFVELKKQRQENPKTSLKNFLTNILPNNFVNFVISEINFDKNLADLSNKKIFEIAEFLNNFSFIPKDSEGFEKAEVTKGGVDVNEISSKNFEAKKCKNLYFIGEVLDVTGWLGGYNFQWAWSSAFIAAQNL